MNLQLSSSVTDVPRVGPAKAQFLRKLGISRVRDFLYTFPRRYDDFSQVTPIAQLRAGATMTVRGRVKSVKTKWGFRGRQRLLRIFVDIEDDTGTLAVTWYNLRFLAKQLWPGRQLYVAGKVEGEKGSGTFFPFPGKKVPDPLRMRSPVLEFAGAQETTHTGRITPVYPETYGVTSRFLRSQVKQLLPLLSSVPEYLPAAIRRRRQLIGIHQAIREVHFPTTAAALAAAQARLRFDELFFLQLAALHRRRTRQKEAANPISVPQANDKFLSRIPYQLTAAQQRSLAEITADLARPVPMNRLLQGDVGSGKSIVAQAAAHLALATGYQVYYLAPTEVLARQQYESFRRVLGSRQVALLIGSLRPRERDAAEQRLKRGEPMCAVGTHALLNEAHAAPRLALVIIDEQHRFGVLQRAALIKGSGTFFTENGKKVPDPLHQPHLLSMTATPIPRTLNLTVLGDLDISILDELPPGRRAVRTAIVPSAERDAAILHILAELHAGRQAYVIAPLVEESDRLEVKSATATADEMRRLFPDIAVGLLHGQLPSAEKERVLRHFSAGALQLLVATAIVEVGVNVPSATIMIIEGAERFGLAQLHQFRGRIGRGEHQSFCYLFPTTAAGAANPRLVALAATTDGFAIAEEDLRLRGPGEVYGVAQSGFGDLKVASLLDYPTIKKARQEAERLLKEDPDLDKYPILQAKVKQKNVHAHFE